MVTNHKYTDIPVEVDSMNRQAMKCLLTTLLIIGGHGNDISTSLTGTDTTGNKPTNGVQADLDSSPTKTSSPDDQSVSSLVKPSTATTVSPQNNVQRSGIGSNWFNDFSFDFPDLSTSYHSTLNCSEPNNPSLLFSIGVDGTGYPVTEINAEIVARPNFGQFLVQEIPGPIVVPPDAVFDSANRTCPGVAFNVFSFLSPTRGGCWVLQGYQDPLFTVVCQLGDCVGCNNAYTSTTSHVGTSLIYKNRCIPQYKSISVWAYCPLIGFPAIVREQVIVPSFCSCVQTPCVKTTTSSGW